MTDQGFQIDPGKTEMFRATEANLIIAPYRFGRVGEIIVPDSAKGSLPPIGIVVHVGPGHYEATEPDRHRPAPCKAGDYVLFNGEMFRCTLKDHEGRIRYVLPFSAIYGVVDPDHVKHISTRLVASRSDVERYLGTE